MRPLLLAGGVLLMNAASAEPSKPDPYLPAVGAVIRSGGLMSSSRILIYDQTRGTLRHYTSADRRFIQPDVPLSAPITLSWAQQQTINQHLKTLWDAKDQRPFMAERPTADWDVLITIRLGGKIQRIQSFGPPRGELKTLYEMVWTMVETAP